MSSGARFTIQCYSGKRVAHDHPDHPRHTFPEDWDSASHPRFDFERLQTSFERLIAKGYTVHADSRAIKIRNKYGEEVMFMELPS